MSVDSNSVVSTRSKYIGLQVIGLGMPRTGTISCRMALETLGFHHGYHWKEIRDKHAEHKDKWIRAKELSLKQEVVDWDGIFSDTYSTSSGTPACYYYKELMVYYPNALFVLTTRDNQKWFTSIYATVRIEQQRRIERAAKGDKDAQQQLCLFNALRPADLYENAEKAIQHKEAYEACVKATIPAHRLLVYHIADQPDGWEPLCRFLKVPVPDAPFPQSNNRKEFVGNFLHPKNTSAVTPIDFDTETITPP